MGSQEQATPLEMIAGLHGCITRWQSAGAEGGDLLYPRNGDALTPLPKDTPAVVSARLASEHDQAALLEVNGFSGWTVRLNGEEVARRDLVPGWGNCFPLSLRRGENRIGLRIEVKEGPRLLGARLIGENREPISGVSQIFTAPARPSSACTVTGTPTARPSVCPDRPSSARRKSSATTTSTTQGRRRGGAMWR